MDTILLFELAIALIHITSESHSLPVVGADRPWSHPCLARNNPVTSWTGPSSIASGLPEPTLKELVTELRARSREVHALAKKLKQKIFHENLHSSSSISNYMKEKHLDGFPTRGDVISWQSDKGTKNVIRRDFINLSRVAVFIEQIIIDATKNGDTALCDATKELENGIYRTLCQLDTILNKLGVTIDNQVSRCVMSAALRGVTTISQRNTRNFLIFRDTVILLSANCVNYGKME